MKHTFLPLTQLTSIYINFPQFAPIYPNFYQIHLILLYKEGKLLEYHNFYYALMTMIIQKDILHFIVLIHFERVVKEENTTKQFTKIFFVIVDIFDNVDAEPKWTCFASHRQLIKRDECQICKRKNSPNFQIIPFWAVALTLPFFLM